MATFNESSTDGFFAIPNIPEKRGVYWVVLDGDTVVYVGKSQNLRRRIAYLVSHVSDKKGRFLHRSSHRLLAYQELGGTARVFYKVVKDHSALEKQMIKKYNPPWNVR